MSEAAAAAGILAILSILVFQGHTTHPLPRILDEPQNLPAAIVVPQEEPGISISTTTPQPPLFQYIEVLEGCGPYFEGPCVNVRSGPGTEYPVVTKLRIGMVLKVTNTSEVRDGHEWYKIQFDDEEVRYRERITGDWFVAADVVRLFYDDGDHELNTNTNESNTKRIIVDRSEQMLYAYDGDTLFMQEPISTGLELTPTPRGTFAVYKMTPSRYMQGPLPGVRDQYYDLPGVPWNLYFTYQGAVIHGAYWHDHFGQPWSHGCVNLPPQKAKELYMWADIGTPVTVQD